MNEDRPGIYTTEFWVALGSKISTLVVAVVALLGAKPETQSALGVAARDATIGVGAIAVFGWVAYSYLKSRTQVKVAGIEGKARVQSANATAAVELAEAFGRAIRLP